MKVEFNPNEKLVVRNVKSKDFKVYLEGMREYIQKHGDVKLKDLKN